MNKNIIDYEDPVDEENTIRVITELEEGDIYDSNF